MSACGSFLDAATGTMNEDAEVFWMGSMQRFQRLLPVIDCMIRMQQASGAVVLMDDVLGDG
ncbi:hypothetical protein FUT69_10955 [Xylella taiwanensis]|uniref:Uncharacterized protein n=1 Tax=Xylella taiwanensis TaxID=1444770 RepID=Z9JK77_9GAMM|nr:hypothetical protein [Xylella taiwanensis]AXI83731.1 hypothetical protein AB672_07220 [Xylella taiwanensis]EWS78241.1 hypothetical protein AF72_06975 [Xylella taiwanensis]MCD8456834.1 hypothetical protein [Xylella taiwanensis]MCD8459243.1 hypothetical protein [Xylella taiwanensis]MCD8461884.1 hypothetical protein [Xylella taiwanensis]